MRVLQLSAILASLILASPESDADKARGFPCCPLEESSSNTCILPPVPQPPEVCCETITLFKYDFKLNVPQFDPYTYTPHNFGTPEPPITWDDGTFVTSVCSGALVSNPFTLWSAPTLTRQEDHFKYLAFSDDPVLVPENGSLTITWVASARTYKNDQSPFPADYLDGDDDYRLSNAHLATLDAVNNVMYNIMLTNDRVYAFYSVLPSFTSGGALVTAAFTVVVPMKVRKPCDWHKLKITFNPPTGVASGYVTYFVDGFKGFTILKPGFHGSRDYVVADFGGVESVRNPQFIYYGFGTGAFVDYYPTCQKIPGCDHCSWPLVREALVDNGSVGAIPQYSPVLGSPYPARFLNTGASASAQENHIWGQGVVLNMTRLTVTQDVCWGQ